MRTLAALGSAKPPETQHAISHYLKQMIADSLSRIPEEIHYDVTFAPAQSENGVVIMYLVVFHLRGPILGSWISGLLQMPWTDNVGGGMFGKTQSDIDSLVRENVDLLLKQRSEILSSNGGGLITP